VTYFKRCGTGADDTAMRAYGANRTIAVEMTMESDSVAVAIQKLLEAEPAWEGTATELLERLSAGDSDPKGWPRSAAQMSNQLRRIAPALRKVGYRVTQRRRRGKSHIELRARMSLQSSATIATQPEKTAGLSGGDGLHHYSPLAEPDDDREAFEL